MKKKSRRRNRNRHCQCKPEEMPQLSEMQELRLALMKEEHKNEDLAAQNTNLRCQINQQRKLIDLLEASFHTQVKATDSALIQRRKQGDYNASIWSNLVKERRHSAAARERFAVCEQNMTAAYTSLTNTCEKQGAELLECTCRENMLKFELRQTEEDFKQEVRRLKKVINKKEREITKLKSEVQALTQQHHQTVDKVKQSQEARTLADCLRMKQVKPDRKRKSMSKCSDDEQGSAVTSPCQELPLKKEGEKNEHSVKRKRKTKRVVKDDEFAGPSYATALYPPWLSSTPYSHFYSSPPSPS